MIEGWQVAAGAIPVAAGAVGYWLGARAGAADMARAAAAVERMDAERKRLDRERRALRDLLLVRSPADAAELERAHAEAEREPPPRREPPAWMSHPAVASHRGPRRFNSARGVVQLLDAEPSAGGQVIKEIPIGPDGRPVAKLVTPDSPA